MTPVHHTYELLIILAALAGMSFAALRAIQGRRGTDPSGYFLANRDIGWLSLGASLFVTSLWGFWSLTTATQVVPGSSLWLLAGAVVAVALIGLGLGFVSPYKVSNAATVPSFLGERFGKQVGFAIALASIAISLFIHIPLTILIGTRVVGSLMGWDLTSSGLLMVVVPGLFVVAGGYPSAIAMQKAGSVAAGIGLLFLAVNGLPGGDRALQQPVQEAVASWPTWIFLAAIVGIWSICIEQQVVQRIFATRSSSQARTGSYFAAALVLLGLVALSAGSGNLSSSRPLMSSSSTAAGFIAAGIIACVMASLSAHFMSVSALITMDLVRPTQKAAGEAALVLIGRLTSTVVVILAIVIASSLALTGPILLEWMLPLAVVLVAPIVVIVVLGLSLPRMHGRGALWGLIAGWAAGAVQMSMDIGPGRNIIETVLVTFVVSAVVFVSVSLTVAPLGTLRKVPGTILQVRKP